MTTSPSSALLFLCCLLPASLPLHKYLETPLSLGFTSSSVASRNMMGTGVFPFFKKSVPLCQVFPMDLKSWSTELVSSSLASASGFPSDARTRFAVPASAKTTLQLESLIHSTYCGKYSEKYFMMSLVLRRSTPYTWTVSNRLELLPSASFRFSSRSTSIMPLRSGSLYSIPKRSARFFFFSSYSLFSTALYVMPKSVENLSALFSLFLISSVVKRSMPVMKTCFVGLKNLRPPEPPLPPSLGPAATSDGLSSPPGFPHTIF
mmetsp:Transcript_5529/g.16776  ORF Transcript_5529/g.16776 Transcript_5529/m.16776 type:complete len:262 (-) Transcript_5529:394-1179(-)